MAKYVLSRKAISDLTEIWRYTYLTWSETQADKYYEIITSTFKIISTNPAIGKNYDAISPGLFGIRVGQHIVFYRKSKANHIQVIRILHVRMDLNSNIEG